MLRLPSNVYKIKMAYILNDPTIFGTKLNPFEIYQLSVDVIEDDFLPVRWLLSVQPMDLILFAAKAGSIKCLQYLHKKGYPWKPTVCRFAAANGHLDCLKYLKEQGCPWKEELVGQLQEMVISNA